MGSIGSKWTVLGRRGKSFAIILGIVAATTLLVAAVVATRPVPESVTEIRDPRVPVEVREVRAELFRRSATLLGTARAVERALVAAEVGGRVVRVDEKCEPGQRVEKGEVLLQLDPEPFRIALASADARLDRARAGYEIQKIKSRTQQDRLAQSGAELDVAEKELARMRELLEQQVVSASEYERIVASHSRVKNQNLEERRLVDSQDALLAQVRADLNLARAERERAALDLARTGVRAPFSGEVAARLVSLGNNVTPGQAVFEIVDYRTAVVELEIPAAEMDMVRRGAEVRVSTSEGRPVGTAELRYVGPQADETTRLFPARVYVDNTAANDAGAEPLRPGRFVSVRLTEREPAERLVVPFSAVSQDGRGEYVFVVRGGRALKRSVRVLWQEDGRAVVSGLGPGEKLVVRGQENLVDRAEVAVTDMTDGADQTRPAATPGPDADRPVVTPAIPAADGEVS